ncbi:stalk domain-containing protein [Cohnella hongkongensis]|uniref:Stalk domain-containing protein n=1 Tax=Cohnella hongkongensis TaxID=178337 RepID=A0ABV9FFQ3_9BACL
MKSTIRKAGMKAALILAVAAAAVPSLQPEGLAEAAASQYAVIEQPVEVNGNRVSLSAINSDHTTYVAVRSLNDLIGLNTRWDQKSKTVTVTGRDRELALNTIDGSAVLNDQRIYGLPAILHNDTTYVPFRFLLERMGYGVSYDPETKEIGIEAIQENALRVTTGTIQEIEGRKSIRVHYPVLSGFAREDVQNAINEVLKKDAELNADLARTTLANALEEDDASYDVSFEGTYTVTYNEQDRLSLFVDYHSYTGGAHGLTARVPYTFDLKTGKLLTLKDVTEGNGNYVSIINDTIQRQIKARGIVLLNPFKTIEPDRDFFLKHNGVVVYFSEYEYTPYAAGMPEFETPFSAFR